MLDHCKSQYLNEVPALSTEQIHSRMSWTHTTNFGLSILDAATESFFRVNLTL